MTRNHGPRRKDKLSFAALLLLACFSGLLVASPFAPLEWSPLALIALAPWLYLMESAGGKWAVLLPWFSVAVFFLALLYWIPRVMVVFGGLSWGISVPLYVLLCFALALFYLPAIIAFLFIRAMHPRFAYLLFPFGWVTCDLMRNFWMVNGFPWGGLGYSQIDRLWAQTADLGGIYLVTFVVVAVNGAVTYAWVHRSVWAPVSAAVVLLGVAGAYGLWRATEPAPPSNLTVGVVQPAVELNPPTDAYLRQMHLVEIPAMTRQAASQGARLIVLPEVPSEFDYYRDSVFEETYNRLAAQHRVALMLNNTTRKGGGEYYNSMVFLGPDGTARGRYDKIHLVPFGEYVPASGLLSFVSPLVREVSSFSRGGDIVVVDLGGVRVGGFICYEAVFPELVRQFPASGAEVLVNITNDAWYGPTAAAAQHFQMARMRAVETRRFLVRAANSGISAVIEPTGTVKGRLNIFEKGTLVVGVRPLQGLTFYVRHGDLFAQFCVVVFVIGLLVERKSEKK